MTRGEYRQAAGAVAQAVLRSVELIVQPDAHDVVGEMGVRGDSTTLILVGSRHLLGETERTVVRCG
jgi:hypothetical protein